ncbi:MAG: class I SAM-dependent methyltransferase [Patescibacteria group bacterium]
MENKYDEAHFAEIYDQIEKRTDDIPLLTKFAKNNKLSKILEPFCGSGRILLPLVKAGFDLTGIDQSQSMLNRLQRQLDDDKLKAELIHADVLKSEWPKNFDLVILGGNSFYEFGNGDDQELCVKKAAQSLRPGGFVYIENDNMEGKLDKSWQKLDVRKHWFPSGVCKDGTKLDTTVTTKSFDVDNRIWRAERVTKITYPDGSEKTIKQDAVTHPSSAVDIQEWLEKYGFKKIEKYSSTKQDPYYSGCKRAVFWAQKKN